MVEKGASHDTPLPPILISNILFNQKIFNNNEKNYTISHCRSTDLPHC